MGRNKIDITFIKNEKKRKNTFKKRKVGLLKKAKELSILCGLDVHVSLRNIETETKEEKVFESNKKKSENLKILQMKKTERNENINLDFLRKYECVDNYNFNEEDHKDLVNEVVLNDVYLF